MAAENRYFYYEDADPIACAATYAFHPCQAHAFINGNKRVAFGAAAIFLEINDCELTGTDEELIDLFLGLAAGQISREQLEVDFCTRVKPHS
jgi:death-on-curing protein